MDCSLPGSSVFCPWDFPGQEYWSELLYPMSIVLYINSGFWSFGFRTIAHYKCISFFSPQRRQILFLRLFKSINWGYSLSTIKTIISASEIITVIDCIDKFSQVPLTFFPWENLY